MTALLASGLLGASAIQADTDDWQQIVTHDIPYRLLATELPFSVEYNNRVQDELSSYLRTGRRETEIMLGRTPQYFPIFEHYLKVHRLPDALKYIPLLESRLKPTITSASGAVGLWQFMPATAEGLGLRINEYVDERQSPYQVTEAAVRYLAKLHDRFEDWGLALAAYNCGPGRVKRALERTGCTTFWDIQHQLPRQTRQYLPRIIATIYVGHHYKKHGLQPKQYQYQAGHFRVFRIHHNVDLKEIALYCKLDLSWLRALNPGYLDLYTPKMEAPHYLILPEQALSHFAQYINKESRKAGTEYAIAVLDSQWKSVDSRNL